MLCALKCETAYTNTHEIRTKEIIQHWGLTVRGIKPQPRAHEQVNDQHSIVERSSSSSRKNIIITLKKKRRQSSRNRPMQTNMKINHRTGTTIWAKWIYGLLCCRCHCCFCGVSNMILFCSLHILLFSSPSLSPSLTHALNSVFCWLTIVERISVCIGFVAVIWMMCVNICAVLSALQQLKLKFIYIFLPKKKEKRIRCSVSVFLFFFVLFLSVFWRHITSYKSHTAITNGMLRLKFTWKLQPMRNSFSFFSGFVSFICSSIALHSRSSRFYNWNIKTFFPCAFVFTVIASWDYFGFGISSGNNIQHSTNKYFHNAKQIRSRW